jgi:predicted permease
MPRLLRRLWSMMRFRRVEADLDEELQFHRAMKERELEREGRADDEARFAARAALGNVTRAREDARAVWIWPWLDSVWQDGAYAARSLRRQPGFMLAAVAVLGLAIGLNTSLFTVFAGLALRPMPGLTDPARVVSIAGASGFDRGVIGLPFPEFQSLAADTKTFSGLTASRAASVSLESERVGRSTAAYLVTSNYFDVLGVRFEHGRGFRPDEDRRGSAQRVVVLGYGLWQTRFGGTPAMVGRAILINGLSHVVVGIVSRDFTGPEGAPNRIWLPLSLLPTLRPNDPFAVNMLDRPQDCCVDVLGRLSPGVSRTQARAEVAVLSDRFRTGVGLQPRAIVVDGTQFLRGRRAGLEVLAMLGVVFLAMLLVLLLACANVGNLLLARSAARVTEIGVRMSLGADRRRIVRQLMTEGFVLALIASGIGIALSMYLPPLFLARVAGHPRPFDVDPDPLVLAYAVGLAAIACLAFALAPALHATRRDVAASLKSATFEQRWRFPLRSALLGIQVAVAVVLLTSAGLLARGVAQARVLDLGFAVEDVGIATIDVPETEYDDSRGQAFLTAVTDALHQSGVDSFSFVSNEPLGDGSSRTVVRLPGEREDQMQPVEFIAISPGYFNVLRIPLVQGRAFTDADAGRLVAIVNETMARRHWPGENPVGRTFIGGGRAAFEVIGVAKDAYVGDLDAIDPVYFQPVANGLVAPDFPKLLFTSGPGVSAVITNIIERMDARARVEIAPLRDRFENQLSELTIAPLVASILGTFSLGLATLGVFGVFAYVVRQRTKELGIRLALGARSTDVVRLVLAGHSTSLLVGLGAGIAGAIGASQLLRRELYGLNPLDPVTYAGVALLLALAAAVASYIPARRAARVNPVLALRHE